MVKSKMETNIVTSIWSSILVFFSIVTQGRVLKTIPQGVYDGVGQFVPSFGRFWQRAGDGNELLHLEKNVREKRGDGEHQHHCSLPPSACHRQACLWLVPPVEVFANPRQFP